MIRPHEAGSAERTETWSQMSSRGDLFHVDDVRTESHGSQIIGPGMSYSAPMALPSLSLTSHSMSSTAAYRSSRGSAADSPNTGSIPTLMRTAKPPDSSTTVSEGQSETGPAMHETRERANVPTPPSVQRTTSPSESRSTTSPSRAFRVAAQSQKASNGSADGPCRQTVLPAAHSPINQTARIPREAVSVEGSTAKTVSSRDESVKDVPVAPSTGDSPSAQLIHHDKPGKEGQLQEIFERFLLTEMKARYAVGSMRVEFSGYAVLYQAQQLQRLSPGDAALFNESLETRITGIGNVFSEWIVRVYTAIFPNEKKALLQFGAFTGQRLDGLMYNLLHVPTEVADPVDTNDELGSLHSVPQSISTPPINNTLWRALFSPNSPTPPSRPVKRLSVLSQSPKYNRSQRWEVPSMQTRNTSSEDDSDILRAQVTDPYGRVRGSVSEKPAASPFFLENARVVTTTTAQYSRTNSTRHQPSSLRPVKVSPITGSLLSDSISSVSWKDQHASGSHSPRSEHTSVDALRSSSPCTTRSPGHPETQDNDMEIPMPADASATRLFSCIVDGIPVEVGRQYKHIASDPASAMSNPSRPMSVDIVSFPARPRGSDIMANTSDSNKRGESSNERNENSRSPSYAGCAVPIVPISGKETGSDNTSEDNGRDGSIARLASEVSNSKKNETSSVLSDAYSSIVRPPVPADVFLNSYMADQARFSCTWGDMSTLAGTVSDPPLIPNFSATSRSSPTSRLLHSITSSFWQGSRTLSEFKGLLGSADEVNAFASRSFVDSCKNSFARSTSAGRQLLSKYATVANRSHVVDVSPHSRKGVDKYQSSTLASLTRHPPPLVVNDFCQSHECRGAGIELNMYRPWLSYEENFSIFTEAYEGIHREIIAREQRAYRAALSVGVMGLLPSLPELECIIQPTGGAASTSSSSAALDLLTEALNEKRRIGTSLMCELDQIHFFGASDGSRLDLEQSIDAYFSFLFRNFNRLRLMLNAFSHSPVSTSKCDSPNGSQKAKLLPRNQDEPSPLIPMHESIRSTVAKPLIELKSESDERMRNVADGGVGNYSNVSPPSAQIYNTALGSVKGNMTDDCPLPSSNGKRPIAPYTLKGSGGRGGGGGGGAISLSNVSFPVLGEGIGISRRGSSVQFKTISNEHSPVLDEEILGRLLINGEEESELERCLSRWLGSNGAIAGARVSMPFLSFSSPHDTPSTIAPPPPQRAALGNRVNRSSHTFPSLSRSGTSDRFWGRWNDIPRELSLPTAFADGLSLMHSLIKEMYAKGAEDSKYEERSNLHLSLTLASQCASAEGSRWDTSNEKSSTQPSTPASGEASSTAQQSVATKSSVSKRRSTISPTAYNFELAHVTASSATNSSWSGSRVTDNASQLSGTHGRAVEAASAPAAAVAATPASPMESRDVSKRHADAVSDTFIITSIPMRKTYVELTLGNGDLFAGYHNHAGLRDRIGVYTYVSSGATYFGGWKNDLRHGDGIYLTLQNNCTFLLVFGKWKYDNLQSVDVELTTTYA